MSRDDEWEDDQPRRRMDRWGEEESDPESVRPHAPSSDRSGVVTTAAVVTLILGCLVLLAGLCGAAGMLMAGTAMMGMPGGRPEWGGMLLVLLVCMIILLWGVGAVASGIGLLNRRKWARVLTLILGGFGAAAGCIFLFIAIAVWFAPNFGPMGGVMIVTYLFYLFLGLLLVGYCLWTYLILLSSRYSVEFR